MVTYSGYSGDTHIQFAPLDGRLGGPPVDADLALVGAVAHGVVVPREGVKRLAAGGAPRLGCGSGWFRHVVPGTHDPFRLVPAVGSGDTRPISVPGLSLRSSSSWVSGRVCGAAAAAAGVAPGGRRTPASRARDPCACVHAALGPPPSPSIMSDAMRQTAKSCVPGVPGPERRLDPALTCGDMLCRRLRRLGKRGRLGTPHSRAGLSCAVAFGDSRGGKRS